MTKNHLSNKQIKANRLNALKSTGPKTSDGKRKASINSIKHGFSAKKFIIEDENHGDFKNYMNDFLEILSPKNILEQELALQIIITGWKYRRYVILETKVFNKKIKEEKDQKVIFVRWADPEQEKDKIQNEPIRELEKKNVIPKQFEQMGALFKLSVMEHRQLANFHKLLENYQKLKNDFMIKA